MPKFSTSPLRDVQGFPWSTRDANFFNVTSPYGHLYCGHVMLLMSLPSRAYLHVLPQRLKHDRRQLLVYNQHTRLISPEYLGSGWFSDGIVIKIWMRGVSRLNVPLDGALSSVQYWRFHIRVRLHHNPFRFFFIIRVVMVSHVLLPFPIYKMIRAVIVLID